MPYQSTPADKTRAYIIGSIYVILAIVLAWMLIKIWPPIPWPAPKNAEDRARTEAYLAQFGCPSTPTPTPTPTASPSPATTPTPAATSTASPARAAGAAASTQTPTPSPSQTPTASPSPTATPTPSASSANGVIVDQNGQIVSVPIRVDSLGICRKTTFDERLLLLVIVAGVLGAFVHGATSLADYIGNNNFNKSWTWFYLLRPPIGMSLALVFYFVIRGGFLSTAGGAQDINPYGIAALAGLVGMFSKQATDKLSEVFGTLFRSAPGEGDAKRGDPLKPKPGGAPIQPDPSSVAAGGDAFTLTVSGTGFVDGATIHVDDAPQTTAFGSATKVSAQIPKEKIAQPATLKITVVNPDHTTFGPADLIVSAGAPPPAEGGPPPAGGPPPQAPPVAPDAVATEEKPVDGEGGDEDAIDGCDVEMKADTPDEELPITKGGVEE